jgi:hypothetical protein
MKLYVATEKAGPVVAGRKHTGAGAHLLLSDAAAAEPLAAGAIRLSRVSGGEEPPPATVKKKRAAPRKRKTGG